MNKLNFLWRVVPGFFLLLCGLCLMACGESNSGDSNTPSTNEPENSEPIIEWESQTSSTTETLTAVYFADENKGWAVGNWYTILATTDGGATWTSQAPAQKSDDLYDMHFVNSSHGWIVGDAGTILATADGGVTWSEQHEGGDNQRRRMGGIISGTPQPWCGAA